MNIPAQSLETPRYSSEKIRKILSYEDLQRLKNLNQDYLEKIKNLRKEILDLKSAVFKLRDKKKYRQILRGLKK